MNRKALLFTVTCSLMASANVLACEYKAGETKFLDYANCRYGEDSINNRSQIGNPCYLTKQRCDQALKASKQ